MDAIFLLYLPFFSAGESGLAMDSELRFPSLASLNHIVSIVHENRFGRVDRAIDHSRLIVLRSSAV